MRAPGCIARGRWCNVNGMDLVLFITPAPWRGPGLASECIPLRPPTSSSTEQETRIR